MCREFLVWKRSLLAHSIDTTTTEAAVSETLAAIEGIGVRVGAGTEAALEAFRAPATALATVSGVHQSIGTLTVAAVAPRAAGEAASAAIVGVGVQVTAAVLAAFLLWRARFVGRAPAASTDTLDIAAGVATLATVVRVRGQVHAAVLAATVAIEALHGQMTDAGTATVDAARRSICGTLFTAGAAVVEIGLSVHTYPDFLAATLAGAAGIARGTGVALASTDTAYTGAIITTGRATVPIAADTVEALLVFAASRAAFLFFFAVREREGRQNQQSVCSHGALILSPESVGSHLAIHATICVLTPGFRLFLDFDGYPFSDIVCAWPSGRDTLGNRISRFSRTDVEELKMTGLLTPLRQVLLLLLVALVGAAGCRNGNEDEEEEEVVELSCEAGFDFESVLTWDAEILNPAVAVGPNGRIWIAFVDLGTVSISVAFGRQGETFEVEQVETITTPISPLDMVVDAENQPHIVYRSETTDSIRHAWRSDGDWDVDDVPQSTGGIRPSVDVTASGTVFVSFARQGATGGETASLRFASLVEGEWDIETLRGFTGTGFVDSSLRVDGSGQPRMSFFGLDGLSLEYGRRQGSSWDIATVEQAPDDLISVGGFNALALTSTDEPRIAYSYVVSRRDLGGGGG